MTKEQFLKNIASILILNGLYRLETAKHSVKMGLVYENDKQEYLVAYYDIPINACVTIFVKKYDKAFKEIESNEYYSDDDAADYLDSFKELKESQLNKELSGIFTDVISFINYKDKTIIN